MSARPGVSPPGFDVPPGPLHRNGNYVLLWSGAAVSALGSQLSAIAYPLLVLSLTGSVVQAGAVGSAALFGALVLRLPAGVWVDRWDRRRIMIVSDVVRGLALASIAGAFALDRLTFAHILVVSFVEGCGGVFYRPASTALIRRVVHPSQIRTAVAADEARANAAGLIGPTLGGALYGVARSLPFLLDAVTYLYSLLAAVLVRQPATPHAERHARSTMRRDMGEGLRWINQHRPIRLILLVAVATNFLIVGLQLATLLIARANGATSTQIGLMLGIASGGGVLGAVLAPALTRLVDGTRLVVILTWFAALTIPVMAVWTNVWILGAMLATRMLITPAANTVLIGYQITHTPDRLQGRVASAGYLVAGIASPLAPVLVGALLHATNSTWTLLALTLLAATTATVLTARALTGALHLDARPDEPAAASA